MVSSRTAHWDWEHEPDGELDITCLCESFTSLLSYVAQTAGLRICIVRANLKFSLLIQVNTSQFILLLNHQGVHLTHMQLFKKDFSYLFLERGTEGERRSKTSTCSCLLCAPYWGPGSQPRHVPWLGIEPMTFWFAGWHSIPWATPARAIYKFLIVNYNNKIWTKRKNYPCWS